MPAQSRFRSRWLSCYRFNVPNMTDLGDRDDNALSADGTLVRLLPDRSRKLHTGHRQGQHTICVVSLSLYSGQFRVIAYVIAVNADREGGSAPNSPLLGSASALHNATHATNTTMMPSWLPSRMSRCRTHSTILAPTLPLASAVVNIKRRECRPEFTTYTT